MKVLLVIMVVLLANLYGQKNSRDVVSLHDGSVVKGKIIEKVDGDHIKIETGDGSIFVFKFSDIDSISSEQILKPLASKSATNDFEGRSEDQELTESVSKKPGENGFSITGGIAKALGTGSENMNMGFGLDGTFYSRIKPGICLGAQVGYQKWSFDLSEYGLSSMGASLSYLSILAIMRFKQSSSGSGGFFQPGLGYFNGTATVSGYGQSVSVSEGDFGVSIEGGADLQVIELKAGFKIVFTEGESTKWFNVTGGFNF